VLTIDDLDGLADARLKDAEALWGAGRYEGARYVCGYAVELKLKARICRAHGWTEYPPMPQLAQALKTHNLLVLLMLSTMQTTILSQHGQYWWVVVPWTPEQRYATAAVTAQDAQTMIDAARALMTVL
jgi:hypothetical protein